MMIKLKSLRLLIREAARDQKQLHEQINEGPKDWVHAAALAGGLAMQSPAVAQDVETATITRDAQISNNPEIQNRIRSFSLNLHREFNGAIHPEWRSKELHSGGKYMTMVKAFRDGGELKPPAKLSDSTDQTNYDQAYDYGKLSSAIRSSRHIIKQRQKHANDPKYQVWEKQAKENLLSKYSDDQHLIKIINSIFDPTRHQHSSR